MSDITNTSGIQGPIAAAKVALDEAMTSLAEEQTNPANSGLERVLIALARASGFTAKAIENAATNVNR